METQGHSDGFASTIKALKKRFPSARIGNCILHAAKKVMSKLKIVPKTVREQLSYSFYELFRSAKERKGLKLFSFGQKLRRFAENARAAAGAENAVNAGKCGIHNLKEENCLLKTGSSAYKSSLPVASSELPLNAGECDNFFLL